MASEPATIDRILLAVLNDPVEADSAEQGLEILAARLACDARRTLIAAAIADGVRRGLLHEPVRLLEGALHCSWRLEPTPRGKALAEPSGRAGAVQ